MILLPSSLSAHAPELHQFELVSFQRPFPAPAFSLQNLSGETVTLNDFRGKYLLLNFWATWCIPCQREMPSMEQLYLHFREKPFTIVAISLDEEPLAKVQAFVSKWQLTFPILLDPQNVAGTIYQWF